MEKDLTLYKFGFLIGGVLTIFEKGKELIMMPLLIMLLGIDGYGIYMQIVLIGSVLATFTTCGMGISILRYYHIHPHEISISLIVSILSIIFVGCLWFLVGNQVSYIFHLPFETLYVSFFIAILISFKTIFFGYFRASGQYIKILCYFTTFEAVEICALGIFFFTNFSIDIIRIIYVFLLIRMFPVLLSIFDLKTKLFHRDLKLIIIRERIKFGVSFIPKDLFLWIGHSADRFIISYLMGPVSVGIYASIYRIASIVKFLSQPVSFTAFPNLAKAWDENSYQIFNNKKWKAAGIYLLLSVPVLLFFVILPTGYFSIISEELINARFLLIWISVGLIIHTIQVLTGYYVYVFSNKVWRYTLIISSVNVIGLFSQYYLLLIWGLQGAAIGSFFIYFFLWIIILIDSSTFISKSFPQKNSNCIG